CYFSQFHEERGAAASEIVAGCDTSKDGVGKGKLGLARRDERSHLSHQNNQRGLAQIGRFAAHVGSSDEQELLAGWVKANIVRKQTLALLAQEFFDDRMARGD